MVEPKPKEVTRSNFLMFKSSRKSHEVKHKDIIKFVNFLGGKSEKDKLIL
jgi:hypothetical protein